MEIGIVGLARSGKTTVFLAIGGEPARHAASHAAHDDALVAVVAVPDQRVEQLARLAGSSRAVHASVRFTDLPGVPVEQIERRHGLPDSHLQYLGRVDALLAVIRGFDDRSGVPVQVAKDADSIETELIVTDLQRVESRRQKLEKTIARTGGKEREQAEIEIAALIKIHTALNEGRPARCVELDGREDVALRSLALLSQKPIAWLINADEQALAGGADLAAPLIARGLGPRALCAQMNAEMEKEIAELDEQSRAEFMASYGIEEPATTKIISLCFRLLGQILFFTANEKESHAWTVREGATALEAAAAIHSDFASGFIRAEVVSWRDLQEAGSVAAARKKGTLRTEGKDSIVRDGDVIQFLFHR
ncbi:redox-regulated ATPase YchF [Candidatus Sumerlaeota bacterium]|nr:redox-regulated ATPase YchF [Candidatus Sumerlaeota bacterium]